MHVFAKFVIGMNYFFLMFYGITIKLNYTRREILSIQFLLILDSKRNTIR